MTIETNENKATGIALAALIIASAFAVMNFGVGGAQTFLFSIGSLALLTASSELQRV